MGFKSIDNGLVPTRFLCMMAHMVLMVSIFIRRDDYIDACDKDFWSDRQSLDAQIISALSISIAFLVIELVSFMIGLSLFNSFQLVLSTLFHSTAAITLSCMLLYEWCSVDFWPVFAICSCVPLFTEAIIMFSVWIFKRPVS